MFFSAPQLKRDSLGSGEISLQLVLFLVGGFGVAVSAWLLWHRWTPLLRFRAKWHYGRLKNACRRYLDGSDSIEEAARRMVSLLKEPPNLGGYTEDFGPLAPVEGAQASLVSVNLLVTPKGYSPADPRVYELLELVIKEFPQSRGR